MGGDGGARHATTAAGIVAVCVLGVAAISGCSDESAPAAGSRSGSTTTTSTGASDTSAPTATVATGVPVTAAAASTSAPAAATTSVWAPPDPASAESTRTFLTTTGAPLPAVVTEIGTLAAAPPADVAACQAKAAELDAGMTPSATLDLAAQTPDPVLGELLVDLVSATGDALQACQGATAGTPDPWATVRLVLGYISQRRAELGA